MIRNIIFDLDGTLLYTLDDIKAAMDHALLSIGCEPLSLEEVRACVGSGLLNALKMALSLRRQVLGEAEIEDLYQKMISFYEENLDVHTREYEGITELLTGLCRNGVALAVLSNKNDRMVKSLIASHFPAIPFCVVEGKRKDGPLKPDARLTLSILERMGAKVEETVLVGDSEVDYRTAVNAGLKPMVVSYGFRTRKELEDSLVVPVASSVKELSRLLSSHLGIKLA